MKLKFWGVRGSIPAPLTQHEYQGKIREVVRRCVKAGVGDGREIDAFVAKLPFHLSHICGGNTACVSIEQGETVVILDSGSGIKELGNYLRSHPAGEYHLFLSHLHWDHVIGLPFFPPVYTPGRKLHIYSFQPGLRASIAGLFAAPSFPVDFKQVKKQIVFHEIDIIDSVTVGDLTMTFSAANHPNGCMNIRIAGSRGKSVVYATDSEYKQLDSASVQDKVDFFRGADLLIFDAMYAFTEAYSAKYEWGHSSAIVGIDLAAEAGVRQILLFHHDPFCQDAQMAEILKKSVRYRKIQEFGKLKIGVAFEGQEIEID
jgi:ribonuclease BN (tRNA processing enzyme)